MPDTSPSAIPTGTVRALSFHSEALQADWNYIVYEPPGYETGALRYPACYLLHGNFGAPRDYIDAGDLPATADRLIAEGKTRAAVIAMPDGGQSWYLNHEATRMEDAILGEFIPHIEKTERVIASRAARRIGGISMGGYGSLRYALKRPDLFAAVALMSPAIYADLPHEVNIERLARRALLRATARRRSGVRARRVARAGLSHNDRRVPAGPAAQILHRERRAR